MTTKERLACVVGLLNSIDARRKHSNNPQAFLAVEQAIVDRELFELEADCSEPIAFTWNEKNRASNFYQGNSDAGMAGVAERERPSHRSLLKRKLR